MTRDGEPINKYGLEIECHFRQVGCDLLGCHAFSFPGAKSTTVQKTKKTKKQKKDAGKR
jgi:hypothetical protein